MNGVSVWSRLANWENRIVHACQNVELPANWHRLLVSFVRIGDGWGWAAVAAGFFILLPRPQFKLILENSLLAVAISLPIYWGLKLGFRRTRPILRQRPTAPRVPPLDRYSFPSGHTMNNLAVAMTLALHFPVLWPFAMAIPLSLGLLRVFYGVHFLTDIAGGALLGVLSSLGAYWLFPRLFS